MSPTGLLTLFVPQAQVSTSSAVTGGDHSKNNTLPQTSTLDNCNVTDLQDVLVIFRDGVNGGSHWADIQAKLLGAFVGFGVLSLLLIYFFVPETKLAAAGKKSRTINYISLEELNHIFKVHTREFIIWQVTEVLPYEVQVVKYILGRRKEEGYPQLKHLHIWAEIRRNEASNNGDADGNDADQGQARSGGGVNEIQRLYNPGPNDSRRTGRRQQRAQQNEAPGQRIRHVNDAEDDAAELPLPNPQYQQAERAGSIDWDPTSHPSPEPNPTRPNLRAGTGIGQASGSPVSSQSEREVSSMHGGNGEATRSYHEGIQDYQTTPEPEGGTSNADIAESDDGGRLHRPDDDSGDRRNALSSPQIRRKPLPPSSPT